MKKTKLFFTTTGFFFGILVAVFGLVLIWLEKPDGGNVLSHGLGVVTLILGIYSGANVAQKGVIGKNYRPELDKEK